MRKIVLKTLYKLFPFDLRGDCEVPPARDGIKLSCIINFYGRLNVLEGILWSLVQQDIPSDLFEVILVEDRGGSEEGRALAEGFSALLPVVYAPLDKHHGLMGYSRNYGLGLSRGEYILFLDDDTVILQNDFLSVLHSMFAQHPEGDAIVPFGLASYGCIEDRYSFHDPFFMSSRCTAYRREVLRELGGFVAPFVGQEDVEFVTRFAIAGKIAVTTKRLQYYHPPLLVPNTRKPRAVGYSFYTLKARYSHPIWLLLLLNCARHAPLSILPVRKFREQGAFGRGFMFGLIDAVRGVREQAYK
ncbi:glycosyltransferase family A protein [Geobacter sp. DSM 9736]|uniref:glycosyltransferase family A protein n=1 Tax=Geobacter sp. DSM 9736 TaxID=1277350 RepID=UPI000B510689|nr:glycosyltransferase family A protein [Geobacter sp. DSM 9736]SNB45831.1 Glycosyl transferase family 2 [Geobacter sp. DSM 9736]